MYTSPGEVTPLGKGNPEIVMGITEIRLQSQRLFEVFDRPAPLPLA